MEMVSNIMNHFNRKNLISTTKRLLSFAFVLVIAFYVFQTSNGSIILDDNDLISQINFVAQGDFIAPISVYIFVWAITHVIGVVGIAIFNYIFSKNLKAKIQKISIKSFIYEENKTQTKIEFPISIYNLIKKSVSKKDYQQFVKDLEFRKNIYEADFIFIIRAIFALIFAVSNNGNIGLYLSIAIFVFFIIYGGITICKMLFAELLPFAVQKISSEMENYIAKKYPKQIIVNAQQDRLEN